MAILCLPVLSAQASPTSDALVIGIQSSKTTSLNPLFPVERDMLSIFDLMYDSLITIDDNYQPQAGLAESWTQTGNGHVKTLKKRRFSTNQRRFCTWIRWEKLRYIIPSISI